MRLNNRNPDTSTRFIDSISGEEVLQIASNGEGAILVAYHLYDSSGALVAETDGLQDATCGLQIQSTGGEMLLNIPAKMDGNLQYCLYGSSGVLLTQSDGVKTKIYPHLRMEGAGRSWVRQPAR